MSKEQTFISSLLAISVRLMIVRFGRRALSDFLGYPKMTEYAPA